MNSVQLSLNIVTIAPESLRSILTSSFASADQRWPLASRHFLSHHRPNSSQPCAGSDPIGRVIEESLLIFGWVANWRPIEVFLYDWWPIVRRRNLYQRLSAAHVTLRPYRNGDYQKRQADLNR